MLWRKLVPDELEIADATLQTITYDLLFEEKRELALRLLEFAVDILPKHSSDINKKMFIVNLAQAYYFTNNNEECRRRIDNEDWSACGLNFQICVQVLRDEFDEAAESMKQIGDDGPVPKEYYTEWPIFQEFRKTDKFRDAYKEVFGHDPVIQETHSEKSKAKDQDSEDEQEDKDALH